jgi:hypothetical protein
MSYNKQIKGIHLKSLLEHHYGFVNPDIPDHIERWGGISVGTVNSNYWVEMLMPVGAPPDDGRRRLLITFIESGGADSVPIKDLDYYTSLTHHIASHSQEIYTIQDNEKILKWMKNKMSEFKGPTPPNSPDSNNEGLNLLFETLNPEKTTILREKFMEFKRNEDINPVRFRVPKPFFSQGENPEFKSGSLYPKFTYKLIEHEGMMSHKEYKALTDVNEKTQHVIVTPFIYGVSPDILIKSQNPLQHLEGLSPENYFEKEKPHRVESNPEYKPLRVCYRVGQALAAFHSTTEEGRGFSLTLDNRMGVDKWKNLLSEVEAQKTNLVKSTGNKDLFDEISTRVNSAIAKWKKIEKDLPKGNLHGDLFPDNVIIAGLTSDKKVRGNLNVGIIDPWGASTDSLLFDVGICIAAWCTTKGGKLLKENAQAFLSGYDSVRERTPLEKRNTLLAAQVGATRFALTRAHMHIQPRDPNQEIELRSPKEFLIKAKLFSTLAFKDKNILEPTHNFDG